MIGKMKENPFVRSAALIASRFNMDPIVVLKSNYFEWAIRSAAANYVAELEAEASAKNKANNSNQSAGGKVPDWIG
jgi:hypothetical protein